MQKVHFLCPKIQLDKYEVTRNPLRRLRRLLLARPAGGWLASLATTPGARPRPPSLASLAKPRLHDLREPLKKRLDLQVKPRPRMASEVGSEVTRSP